MLRTEASTPLAQARQSRVSSIDVVRGLAIVIMVLDHVRDLLHTNSSINKHQSKTRSGPVF
ncbi:heparan-alpha-glucosaminide N-acetyltransferase domain-containing protein [Rufibacter roseolus]|uniref:heparan-alpha-glucosaminide N-acetyltransferase domain-containing protein n=1 Tax=Rufibacter roseolus TaxID=2817375 RepID=UPI001B30D9B2|nr:heparan-alpha-glucosaminide N-acetyltransferase domain-containing protein [Rufibacter roseolus]